MKKGFPEKVLQDAWTGDAVLGLFARQWILAERGTTDGELLAAITSNQFLAMIGRPTEVEAMIGSIYEREGLEAAFAWISAELVPRFELRARRVKKQAG